MGERKKIGIIVGICDQPEVLTVFETLQAAYDIEIFTIDHKPFLKNYRFPFKTNVFENLSDMPGYMRHLDEFVSECDILVALETSRLASFQAIRIAHKLSKPCIILVNEFHPYFYANFPNIRAIQVDVLENADQFWTSSELAAGMLKLEGIAPEKIHPFTPALDVHKFCQNPEKRKKFRDYLKLDESLILVLFKDDIDISNSPAELVNAFRLLCTVNPTLAKKIRIIFAGDGPAAKEVKYLIHDLKISNFFYFLHQDPDPFIVDLYNASDVIYLPRKGHQTIHELYPFQALQAMACGVAPLVVGGSVAHDATGNLGKSVVHGTFQEVCQALIELTSNPTVLQQAQQQARSLILERFADKIQSERLHRCVEKALLLTADKHLAKAQIEESLAAIEKDIGLGSDEKHLVAIEQMLLHQDLSPRLLSQLFLAKGDLLRNLSKPEQAIESYNESLKQHPQNHHALAGLGNLAYQTHSNEEALTFFRKALSINDKDAKVILGIALVYQRLGLNEEAVYWLEKSAMLDLDDELVINTFVQVCLSCTTALPIPALERIVEERGDFPVLLMTLGQLYLRQGAVKKGNEMLARAFKQLEQTDQKNASCLKLMKTAA